MNLRRYLLTHLAVATAVAVCALSGCTTLQNTVTTNTLAAQLVTQEATARVIEAGKTSDERLARAVKISKTAADIKQVWDSTASTLPGLVQIATERIAALKLSPADAILAQALVTELSAVIQQKMCPPGAVPGTGACTIPADKQLFIDQLLDWITNTTKLYGA